MLRILSGLFYLALAAAIIFAYWVYNKTHSACEPFAEAYQQIIDQRDAGASEKDLVAAATLGAFLTTGLDQGERVAETVESAWQTTNLPPYGWLKGYLVCLDMRGQANVARKSHHRHTADNTSDGQSE
jgi:hypothetical protein